MSTTNEATQTVGGPVASSSVSLRVFGSDVHPEHITEILGQAPSMSYQKGDQISRSIKSLRKRGMWLLTSSCGEIASPEDQIVELLNRVTVDLDTWQEIVAKHSVDLYCTIRVNADMSGFSLSGAVLKMLSERGIRVEFEIVEADQVTDGVVHPTAEGIDGGDTDCSATVEGR